MIDFISEFWQFVRVRRKYWLIPIIVMMMIFGGLFVLSKGSAVAPFVYTLF
jgi:ABC-type transport system involved in cytochrome c biogenesis permease subunit